MIVSIQKKKKQKYKLNYKSSESKNKQIKKYIKKTEVNNTDYDSLDFNIILLQEAFQYLCYFHEAENESEFNNEDINSCTDDMYYAFTSGEQEIGDFIETNNITEVILDFFSTAKSFIESYGLLKCINGIIQIPPNDSNPNISQALFQQFEKLDCDLFKDDDEIKYLALFFETFHKIDFQSIVTFIDEPFLQHLLSFQDIDNDVDIRIILVFNQLYFTLPEYPQCLLDETANVLKNVHIHTDLQCAELLSTLSSQIPDILNDPNLIESFMKIFNFGQYPTRALLLNILTILPYSISSNYVNQSIIGFISDSIYKLSSIYLDERQTKIENSDFIAIKLLNYLLENDGDVFIDQFFNQNHENYNLIEPLTIIMESASYSYKEIGGLTFILLIELLIKPENNEAFNEIIENKIFPEQFANLFASVINLDSKEIKNRLIYCVNLFLHKAHSKMADIPFLEEMKYFEIIDLIADDETLDQDVIQDLINSFAPQNINS